MTVGARRVRRRYADATRRPRRSPGARGGPASMRPPSRCPASRTRRRPPACPGPGEPRATGAGGLRDPGATRRRMPRWLRRVLIADPGDRARRGAGLCHPAPGHAVGEHRATAGPGLRPGARRRLPGPPGAVAVRRVAGLHRGSPVLRRTRFRPHRDRPGDRRPRHRAARPGRRHALPATGQDALHAGRRRGRRRGGTGHPRHQAGPELLQAADPAAVRRRRLLRPRLLRPGRGELRLLRRDAGRAQLAAGGAARRAGAGAHRGQPDRALHRWPGRGRRTCSAGWSPPGR